MIYCDTSLMVAALTEEVDSDRASDWLASMRREALAISGWSLTEFASALAAKQRSGAVDAEARLIIEARWQVLVALLRMLSVESKHFVQAADLVDTQPKGLRAGDALHLAVVLDHGGDLATLDLDFAAAARTLGVAVHPTF